MSIFFDFENIFGKGVFSSIPDHDGNFNIMKSGNVVDHISDPYDQSHIISDWDDNGNFIVKTYNGHGGHDTLVNNKLHHSTEDNVHGGTNCLNENKSIIEQSFPDGHGFEHVYDDNMHETALITKNIFGGEDMYAYDDYNSNITKIMNYDDPLSHVGQYTLNGFKFIRGL